MMRTTAVQARLPERTPLPVQPVQPTQPPQPVRIAINDRSAIAAASRTAREQALLAGFDVPSSYEVATAASELAWNVFIHGGGGTLDVAMTAPRPGITLLANDRGPGIADIALALREGYSSAGSLGCGLPAVQRLMDELVIEPHASPGATVRASKWL